MAVCDRYKLRPDPQARHRVCRRVASTSPVTGCCTSPTCHGQLDGIVLEAQGQERIAEWWAEVSIYRRYMRFPFKFRGRYSKAARTRRTAPRWRLKCEALGPAEERCDVSGLPVLEERDAAFPGLLETGATTARLTRFRADRSARETGHETESGRLTSETGEILDTKW